MKPSKILELNTNGIAKRATFKVNLKLIEKQINIANFIDFIFLAGIIIITNLDNILNRFGLNQVEVLAD